MEKQIPYSAEDQPKEKEEPREADSLEALLGVLRSVVHNENLGRGEKLDAVNECLKSLESACQNIVNKSTPRSQEDLVAEITEKAAEAAVKEVSRLLEPLLEKITNLEARK